MEVFEPFYDRVAMEFIKEGKSEGGLFIPETVQEGQASRAKVIAMGPGKYNMDTALHVPMQVKVGDEVYVNPYLGMKIKVSRDRQYLVQKEDEILGRVPPKEAENG